MSVNKILKELDKNKKIVKVGSVELNVEVSKEDVTIGLPLKELLKEMKKASKENLFKFPDNVSTC